MIFSFTLNIEIILTVGTQLLPVVYLNYTPKHRFLKELKYYIPQLDINFSLP